jgi:hypothetical protein
VTSRVFIAFVMVVAAATGQPLAACSCDPDRTLASQRRDAGVIFSGTLLESTEYAGNDANGSETGFRVVFRVDGVWKGRVGEKFEAISGPGNCRHAYTSDQEYLVFAGRSERSGPFWTNRCAGTRAVAPGEARSLLGSPGRPPRQGPYAISATVRDGQRQATCGVSTAVVPSDQHGCDPQG